MEGSLGVEIQFRWDGRSYRWYATYRVERIRDKDQNWVVQHTDHRGTVVSPVFWLDTAHRHGVWSLEVPHGTTCTGVLVEAGDPATPADDVVLDSVTYSVPTTP